MPIKYSDTIEPFALGRRRNMEAWNTITRSAEADGLKFGVPVQPGTARHTCKALSGNAQNILGITEATVTQSASDTEKDAYAEGDSVAICEMGVIGVLLGKAVTAGNQARYDLTAGKWTDAAQSGTVATIPGAQFEESGGADGEIGLVRYRRPVPSVSAAS